MIKIELGAVTVAEVALDYALRIILAPVGLILIEVPATFVRADSHVEVPIGRVDLTGDPVFATIVGKALVDAWATSDGLLTVKFEDDSRVVVAVDDRYESWSVQVPDGIYSAGPDPEPVHVRQDPPSLPDGD